MRQADEGVAAIRERGAIPQIIFNLLEQDIGARIFPVAREHDVSVMARVPHASGLLDGTVRADTVFEPGDHRNWRVTTNEKRKAWLEDGLVKLDKLPFLESGRTIGQAAIQFILREPSMASVLPNITSLDNLREYATYDAGVHLTDAEFERVQALYRRNFGLTPAGANQ
jgi:aryl-alcohol dehydrogenase-like predicted oxidoreductase